ncbi:GntR family transcriptional regulator [Polaromonas sp.]|uniref:GntR family transcriptional regulator n=1 Tax=Polaromonas sp. TaxID=1869339 RepID=UPI0035677AAE
MKKEVALTRFACERMSPEERTAIAELHLNAAVVVENEDEEGWQAVNMEFHEILYRGSRNPCLRQEILRLRTRTGAYRKQAFGSVGRIQTSYAHHLEIVNAIQASDSKAAASTIFLHMSPGHGTRGVADIIVNMPKALLG